MALNGLGSYIPTADEFNSHWVDVNADRVANALPELTLQGGYSQVNFAAERDALDALIISTEGFENARQIAAGQREEQKVVLQDWMSQFRNGIDVHLRTTPYAGAAPTMPSLTSAESKFLRPFDDLEDLWGRINADTTTAGFTPPLLLRAGAALAAFSTDLQLMRTRFKAVTDAENDQDIARKQRDAALDPLKDRMLQYRAGIELEYPEGHAFRESLPDVYASSGGGGNPPDVPEAPVLVGGAPGEVNASWPAVSEAAGYNVFKLEVGTDPDFVLHEAVTVPDSSFTGLTPGITLQVRVTATNANGESAPSDTAEIVVP